MTARISIAVRACYNEWGTLDDPRFKTVRKAPCPACPLTEHRMNLFRNNLLPSLRNQAFGDFEVNLLTGALEEPFRDADWGDVRVNFHSTGGGNLHDWGRRNLAGILAPYSIQAVGATDDWYAPGWTAHMAALADRFGDDVWLIHYEPLLQAPSGILSYHPLYHGTGKTSGYVAMVRRKGCGKGMHVFMDKHYRMGRTVKKVRHVRPGYVFATIHGENKSSGRHSLDNML